MFYILNKLTFLIHCLVNWLYHDSDKTFGFGGVVGAGFTATMIHLNYWYWAKVIVSAIIGGLVNIGIKKLVDSFNQKKEDPNE